MEITDGVYFWSCPLIMKYIQGVDNSQSLNVMSIS